MKIVVVSDSHRNFGVLHRLMELQKDSAQMVLFLGDGVRELEDIEALYPNIRFAYVAGNSDWGSITKSTQVLHVNGVKIMMTHGHAHEVKFSLEPLKKAARAAGCRVVLYGHTHVAYTEYDEGLYVMNPGSIAQSRSGPCSYGVLEIAQGGILMNIAAFE